MVPIDPDSSPSDRIIPVPPETSLPLLTPIDPKASSASASRLLGIVLGTGLIAGVASCLVGEVILNIYQNDLIPTINIHPKPEDMSRLRHARLYSSTLTFAAMGGVLALVLSLAGGLARSSASISARAAILGLLIGTASTAAVAWVVVPIFYQRYDPQSDDLIFPLLTHGAIWSVVGATGGLAFGLGLGGRVRWRTTIAGGLLGAAAATIVYEIVGALAFPTGKTDLPLSSSIITRAMAQLLVAVLSAVGAAVALNQPAKPQAVATMPSEGLGGTA